MMTKLLIKTILFRFRIFDTHLHFFFNFLKTILNTELMSMKNYFNSKHSVKNKAQANCLRETKTRFKIF